MTRKQTMKVYHGVPKNNIDESTIFYADFDGTIKPKIGNLNDSTYSENLKFVNTPTGLGVQLDTSSSLSYIRYKVDDFGDIITCDFVTTLRPNSTTNIDIVGFNNISTRCGLCLFVSVDNALKIYAQDVKGQSANYTITYDYAKNIPLYMRIVRKYSNVSLYINGILKGTITLDSKFNSNIYDSVMIGALGVRNHVTTIADLLVSNIDRGDYFPNLPQDFIDGKAIIKPRMGQQQIKGDPMYSQVTTLKVPSHTDGDWSLYSPVATKGAHRSYNNPELSIAGGTNWSKGSLIRISGLNGEVISGVIDNETALATVTLSANAPITKLRCNSVGGFIAEDTIKIYDPVSKQSTYDRTIQSIDTETKTITLDSILIGTGGNWNVTANQHLIIETTSSSSSPIVKTKEGAKVSGTWSGLGTTVATFTLGENNPSLQGKDLYVEYALTMPCGNSDFSELPYTVEKAWGENGVEMKPVNTINIVDDFKGKIKGSTKECPHFMGWNFSDTLQIPSNFTENDAQQHYNNIASINSLTRNCTTNKQNEIPQQMFSFNLIEIVERKLGCKITDRDKVQWIKDHFESVRIYYTGYGTNHVGNKAYLTIFDQTKNTWLSNWVTNTSSSPSTINGAFIYEHYDRIIPNGILYVLAYTDPSNGDVNSTIYTNYISVEIKLKTDSTYTTLYCENKRAREDKCNPVLVQKETKTVKRYLPSRECFTTECKYSQFKNEGIVSGLDVIANKYFNIGVSTSNYSKYVSGSKININQLPLERAEHLYLPLYDYNIMEPIPQHIKVNITEIPLVYWWSDNGNNIFTTPTTINNFKTCIADSTPLNKGQRGGFKDNSNNVIIYGDIDKTNIISKDGLRIYSVAIVIKNGEMMLYVIKSSSGSRFYIYSDAASLYKIPGNPLIK